MALHRSQRNFQKGDRCFVYKKDWGYYKTVPFIQGFSSEAVIFGILRNGLFEYYKPKQSFIELKKIMDTEI